MAAINSININNIDEDKYKVYNPIVSPFGLVNNGNTCYKNAAFQMLLSIPEYSEYILGDGFTKTLKTRYLDNTKTEDYILDANNNINSDKAIKTLTKDFNVLFYKFLTLDIDSKVKNTRIIEKYLEETQKKLFSDYLTGAPDDSVAFFNILLDLIEKYGFNGCKDNFTNINYDNIMMKAVEKTADKDIAYIKYKRGKISVERVDKNQLINGDLPPEIKKDIAHPIAIYPSGQIINFNAELITKYLIGKTDDKYNFEKIGNLNIYEIFKYCISERKEIFFFEDSANIGKTDDFEGYLQKQEETVKPDIEYKKYLYIRLIDSHTNYKDLYSAIINEMWNIDDAEKNKILSGIGNKFNKFVLSDIIFKDTVGNDKTYNLISVIMYTGGHYYNYSLRNGKWYELNDSSKMEINSLDYINSRITESVRPVALLYSVKQ